MTKRFFYAHNQTTKFTFIFQTKSIMPETYSIDMETN